MGDVRNLADYRAVKEERAILEAKMNGTYIDMEKVLITMGKVMRLFSHADEKMITTDERDVLSREAIRELNLEEKQYLLKQCGLARAEKAKYKYNYNL